MNNKEAMEKFGKLRLTYDEFKNLAKDNNLTSQEKIGFPNQYRKNFEDIIFMDIKEKLLLERNNISVLDIGSGCSDLENYIID